MLTAVISYSPRSARRFSVSMSSSLCSKRKAPVSRRSVAKAQCMKASSGSGLWPKIKVRVAAAVSTLPF